MALGVCSKVVLCSQVEIRKAFQAHLNINQTKFQKPGRRSHAPNVILNNDENFNVWLACHGVILDLLKGFLCCSEEIGRSPVGVSDGQGKFSFKKFVSFFQLWISGNSRNCRREVIHSGNEDHLLANVIEADGRNDVIDIGDGLRDCRKEWLNAPADFQTVRPERQGQQLAVLAFTSHFVFLRARYKLVMSALRRLIRSLHSLDCFVHHANRERGSENSGKTRYQRLKFRYPSLPDRIFEYRHHCANCRPNPYRLQVTQHQNRPQHLFEEVMA